MAILITEARAALKNAVLHCGGSFNDAKLDYAIIETGERFINESGLNRKIATAVTVADDKEVVVSTTTADFTYYDLLDVPFIAPGSSTTAWRRLNPISLDVMRGLHDSYGVTTGEPEYITWISEATCWLFPVPDAVYTLNFPYSQPLTTSTWTAGCQGTYSASTTYQRDDVVTHTPSATAYTYRSLIDGENLNNTPADNASTAYWQLIGTTANVPCPDPQTISLNIHKKWAIAWLRSGARAMMLEGAPGHPDAERAAVRFEQLIERVKDIVTPAGVWFSDAVGDENRSYGPDYMSW